MIKRHQVNPKASYLLSGKMLIHLLSPAKWIHGTVGDVNISENADGSIEIGLDRPQVNRFWVVVNGALAEYDFMATIVPVEEEE